MLPAVGRVDAALDAHLGGAARPRFAGASGDLVQGEIVGPAAQVLAQPALGEGAEAALIDAEVGIGDVAVDDVAHRLAIDFAPQRVGRPADAPEIGVARREQGDDFRFVRLAPGAGFLQRAIQQPARRAGTVAGQKLRLRLRRRRAARRPGIGARMAGRIHQRQRAPPGLRRQPVFCGLEIARINGQALDQHLAGAGAVPRQRLDLRPGRLGIDVIRRDRRDAAPVVDAGLDQARARAGAQVGRGLDARRCAEQDARHGDGPQMLLEGGLGRHRHVRARLGAEILHDDLLQVAVALVQRAQGEQRLDALLPRLADADEDAAGEGNRRLARRRDGRQAHGRMLVGTAGVGAAAPAQAFGCALQHQPHGSGNRAQRLQLFVRHDAGVEVRQQSAALQHHFRHRREIVQGAVMAQPGQFLPRLPIARLGPVAEGEQCLLAAGAPARLGDGQHLLGFEEGLFTRLRLPGERAVAATVAAQAREGDEDLARPGDAVAESLVANVRRDGHECTDVGAADQQPGLVLAGKLPRGGAGKQGSDAVG